MSVLVQALPGPRLSHFSLLFLACDVQGSPIIILSLAWVLPPWPGPSFPLHFCLSVAAVWHTLILELRQ